MSLFEPKILLSSPLFLSLSLLSLRLVFVHLLLEFCIVSVIKTIINKESERERGHTFVSLPEEVVDSYQVEGHQNEENTQRNQPHRDHLNQ